MAVAFDAKSAVTNSATTLTMTDMIVGSGSNRALAVMVWWSTSVGFPTSITVTWDSGGTNQAMTLIASTNAAQSSSSSACAIYGLIAPTSGNKNLVITWTAAGVPEGHAAAISFTGVDQTSVAAAFLHGATDLKLLSAASPTSITVTSAVGNMVVAGHMNQAAVFTATNETTLAMDSTGPQQAVAYNYGAGAASNTLTATFAGSDVWGAVGCDVKAASVAVTAYAAFSLPQHSLAKVVTRVVGY